MESESRKIYNLAERTFRFAERTLSFVKGVPNTMVTRPLVSQLVRSSTSVGANYREAVNTESPNDFRYKVGICRREARESEYWLNMLVVAHPLCKKAADELASEASELTKIFSASVRTVSKSIRK